MNYGLPSPGLFAYAVGVLEVVGGAFLIAGLLTRPAAALLAGDMVGAIVTADASRAVRSTSCSLRRC